MSANRLQILFLIKCYIFSRNNISLSSNFWATLFYQQLQSPKYVMYSKKRNVPIPVRLTKLTLTQQLNHFLALFAVLLYCYISSHFASNAARTLQGTAARIQKDAVVLMNESACQWKQHFCVFFCGTSSSICHRLNTPLFGLRSIFECATQCTRGYRSQFLVEQKRMSFFGLLLI